MNQEVQRISEWEVRSAMKRMSGNVVGPDVIRVDIRRCLGEGAVDILS